MFSPVEAEQQIQTLGEDAVPVEDIPDGGRREADGELIPIPESILTTYDVSQSSSESRPQPL